MTQWGQEMNMKTVNNPEKLEEVWQSLSSFFTSRPPVMRLFAFEKEELLNPPDEKLNQFLIVIEGNIIIYSLLQDGSMRHLSIQGPGTLLGDIEYSGNPNPTLFIEAQSQVICLSIPFAQNREILDQDPVFLRVLIRSLADKLSLSSTLDAISVSLYDKVLVYLQQIQPDHRITSVNHAMTMLHCSRRQLQRVLSVLCRQGILIKEGRGQYLLNPSHPTHP